MKIKNHEELIAKQEEYRASLNSQRKQILICAGTGCVAGGSLEIYAKMKDIIESKGLKCALVLEKDPHGDSIGLKVWMTAKKLSKNPLLEMKLLTVWCTKTRREIHM